MAGKINLKKANKALIKITCKQHLPYNGFTAGSSRSTGFIVDKATGLFVTAGHSIRDGQNTITVTFTNGEESQSWVVFKHPSRDFAIGQYDPNTGPTDVEEILLAPEKLHFGMEVFLASKETAGNLTISRAVIEETEACPRIFGDDFHAFSNSFYVRASTGGKGGSSGSPVLDEDGNAIALQIAGWGGHTNSNIFLPLDEITRILQILKSGGSMTSLKIGDIQAGFWFEQSSYARRYKVPPHVIARMNNTDKKCYQPGFLVGARVLKGGSAEKATLRSGDIVVSGGGQLIRSFKDLDIILGNSIGASLSLEVYRDGQRLSLDFRVQDSVKLVPQVTYRINQSVIHHIPLEIAYERNVPLNCGVYVASAFLTIPAGSILTKLGPYKVQSPKDVLQAVRNTAKASRLVTTGTYLDVSGQENGCLIEVPQKRFLESYKALTEEGEWVSEHEEVEASNEIRPKSFPVEILPLQSQVHVSVYAPFYLSTSPEVMHAPGLLVRRGGVVKVVTTRFSTFAKISEIVIKFSGITIFGNLSSITERHIWIDLPEGALPHDAEIPDFGTDPAPLQPGDDVTLLTFDIKNGNTAWVETKVVKKAFVSFNHNRSYGGIGTIENPVLNFDTKSSTTSALVFRGKRENVTSKSQVATWMVNHEYQGLKSNKHDGLVDSLIEPEDLLESGADVVPMRLPHEFGSITEETASALGIGEDYRAEFRRQYGTNCKPSPLIVKSSSIYNPSGILNGDVVLKVGGKIVSGLMGFKKLVRGKEEVTITVFRDHKEKDILARFYPLKPFYVARCLKFYGLYIIPTDAGAIHGITSEDFDVENLNCFIYGIDPGSPSHQDGMGWNRWLKSINGKEVSCIDDILTFVKESGVGHGDRLRLRTVSGDGTEFVCEVTTDDRYFPVIEILPDHGHPQQQRIQHTAFPSQSLQG